MVFSDLDCPSLQIISGLGEEKFYKIQCDNKILIDCAHWSITCVHAFTELLKSSVDLKRC